MFSILGKLIGDASNQHLKNKRTIPVSLEVNSSIECNDELFKPLVVCEVEFELDKHGTLCIFHAGSNVPMEEAELSLRVQRAIRLHALSYIKEQRFKEE